MRKFTPLKFLLTLGLLLGLFQIGRAQTHVCEGATVSLTVNAHRGIVQWEYSTNGGTTWAILPGANADTATVTPSGTVWYRAAISEGTCAVIYSDTSEVVACSPTADAGADKTYCSTPVTLDGSANGCSAPYTFNWSPSAGLSSPTVGNPTASPAAPTQYILTVTDIFGCIGMDTVFVDTLVPAPGGDSTVFSYTGAPALFIVPPCVDTVILRAWGAQGQDGVIGGSVGGLGGFGSGKLVVTPGETLTVYVGGQAGYNGGGQGGIDGNNVFSGAPIGTYGGYGGGASDVRRAGTALANRVIVAGGGGGGGNNGVWPGCQTAGPGGNGGVGGDLVGGTGGTGVGTPCNCAGGGGAGGTGGTQSAGGVHGGYGGNTACLRSSWGPGADGVLGIGGAGSLLYHNGTGGGGGGGGGYYGGGSAGNGSDTTPGGGGGGGSNYVTGLLNNNTFNGIRSGNGRIVIVY